MGIALFDLDKTLLARNSAVLWLQWELRRRRISVAQAVTAMGWILRYRLGEVALDVPLRRSIATMRGVEVAQFAARTAEFYETAVRQHYRPGAMAALEAHRSAGDRLVLLSSTHTELARLVVADLRLDEALCTDLEVDGRGAYTGAPIEPICFGHGKLSKTIALCERLGASLRDCTFYTDSNSDMPVLEAVGHPVAINADPALARQARRYRWPRLDWGRPKRRRRGSRRATGGATTPSED